MLLEVPDRAALEQLAARLVREGHRPVRFTEPDLGGELTAIAIGPEARRALSSLPLAFR